MAKRPTLTDVTSLTNSSNINAINQNWDAIQTAFDNTLSLDGSTPNAMNSDLDLNGNSLLNVDTLDVDGLTLNGQTVTGLATVPEWKGPWASGQGYVVNDLVKTAGNVYICLAAHTAGGDFSADLTAGNWELFVSKGDSGAGTGDMLSTNNLSDVANPATSRTNLGLGTVAVENTVPVAKGGTGATDAATARTNLGAQASSAFLTILSGVDYASQAEAEAGTDNTKLMTPLRTKTAVLAHMDLSGWHPYNQSDPDTPADPTIYTFSMDGAVAAVETPNFEDGWDYLVETSGISGSSTATLICNLLYQNLDTLEETWGADMVVGESAASSSLWIGSVYSPASNSKIKKNHYVDAAMVPLSSTTVSSKNNARYAQNTGGIAGMSSGARIKRIRLRVSAGTFDSGTFFMFRRRSVS